MGSEVSQEIEENSIGLDRQEWLGLSTQCRDTGRPAWSQQAELTLGPQESRERKPQSYATICKKQLSSARIDSASEREVKMAVKAQPRSNSSVSPVLKVTGRPEGGVAPPIRHIDQFVLKVANGRVMKERRFRP